MIEKKFYYPENEKECSQIICETCLTTLIFNKCYNSEKLAEAYSRSIRMLHLLEIGEDV